MRRLITRTGKSATVALAAILLTGCGIVADSLNPNFFQQFGIDLGPLTGSGGTVLVSVVNDTNQLVTLSFYTAADATDPSRGAQNYAVTGVAAGGIANRVLECPVGQLSPGVLDNNFEPVLESAVVAGDGSTAAYAGAPLLAGADFACGDVVEFRVSPLTGSGAGDDANQEYAITVRVIPGR